MLKSHTLNKNQVEWLLSAEQICFSVKATLPLRNIYHAIGRDLQTYASNSDYNGIYRPSSMIVVITTNELCSISVKNYYTNSIIKITNRHLLVLKQYVSKFNKFIVTNSKVKYPHIILLKSKYSSEQLEFLHTMRINGKLSTKTELVLQLRSIEDVSILDLFGIDFGDCSLSV